MTVRFATADDFESVSRLSTQLAHSHIKGRPDILKAASKPNKREFKKSIKKNQFYYTVIENGGEIIGLCKWQLSVVRENKTFSDRTFAMIWEIIIAENYRHKGLGKLLFNKVAELAKDKGATSVELYVWEFNENAQKFYQSIGMKPQRILLEKMI